MNLTTDSKPTRLWPNSVVIFGLFSAHIILKHWLVFLKVDPVRTDPCDGVNLFAFLSIVCILLGFSWRHFGRCPPAPALRYLYAIRSQQGSLFAIFIALMAEIIALGRHPAMWIRIASPTRVFAFVGALAALTVATQLLILVSQRNRIPLNSLRPTRTMLPALCAIVVLIVCPEWPTYSPSTTAHILTVAVGALVVLVPTRLLLTELVLIGSDERGEARTFGTACEWISLVAGTAVALLLFWPQTSNPGSLSGHIHIPIFVSEISEGFIVYAVLGAPLGFAGRLPDKSVG